MTELIKILVFFLYTLVLGVFMHRFFIIRAERYKIKKANTSAERWGSQTKPILGGLTFYGVFLFAILNYIFYFNVESLINKQIFGIFLAITIAFLMGLADDMLNTPPGFKFIFQILCSFILIYSGIFINIFETLWYNYILTVFWVVGVMNSINMLDNMDAITTSVSISILISAITLMLFLGNFSPFLIMISFGGLAALISFLFYNWNPAKMYMGDNGSQFLGTLLAIVGIYCFWNAPETINHKNTYPFFFAFLAFIIPITDTTTVTINRLAKRKSPFVGGKDHTTHHLSYAGLKESKIAVLLFSVNLIFGLTAVAIITFANKFIIPIWIIGAVAILISLALYLNTRISKPNV